MTVGHEKTKAKNKPGCGDTWNLQDLHPDEESASFPFYIFDLVSFQALLINPELYLTVLSKATWCNSEPTTHEGVGPLIDRSGLSIKLIISLNSIAAFQRRESGVNLGE